MYKTPGNSFIKKYGYFGMKNITDLWNKIGFSEAFSCYIASMINAEEVRSLLNIEFDEKIYRVKKWIDIQIMVNENPNPFRYSSEKDLRNW